MMRMILKASDIPDRTQVCMPTGNKIYTFHKHGLPLHDAAGKKVEFKGMFIQDSEGIQSVTPEKKLAVDLHLEDAIDFLDGILMEDEAK